MIKFLDLFGQQDPTIEYEQVIAETLAEFFPLPHLSTRKTPEPLDLALNINVSKFEPGMFFSASAVRFPIIYLLRPSITLTAELYEVGTGKNYASTKITQAMAWSATIKAVVIHMFTIQVFRYKPIFGPEELRFILGKACLKLIEDWRSVI